MFKNILIIGFGMIGSSIARSVIKKYKNVNIFAFDKSNNLKIRINKSKLNNVKNDQNERILASKTNQIMS